MSASVKAQSNEYSGLWSWKLCFLGCNDIALWRSSSLITVPMGQGLMQAFSEVFHPIFFLRTNFSGTSVNIVPKVSLTGPKPLKDSKWWHVIFFPFSSHPLFLLGKIQAGLLYAGINAGREWVIKYYIVSQSSEVWW
jgi:hypothetical protein